MKRILFFILSLFLFVPTIHAETIYLKNGNTIEGKIVKQTDSMVKVDISGVVITYYKDEISRIEGQAGGESRQSSISSSQPSLSAPVISTELQPTQTMGEESFSKPSVTPIIREATSSTFAGGTNNPPSKSLVLRYFDISGTKENLDALFQDMIEGSDPQDAQRLKSVYNLNEIMEILVPVYQKHFTEDDIKKLIAFYSSPVAQKLSDVSPQVMQDTLDASMLYFQAKLPPQ